MDPKRSRVKWNLGPKRSNFVRIGSYCTPKDRFGWCMRKEGSSPIPTPLSEPMLNRMSERGSKRRHIHIAQHRGSTLPGIGTYNRVSLEESSGFRDPATADESCQPQLPASGHLLEEISKVLKIPGCK